MYSVIDTRHVQLSITRAIKFCHYCCNNVLRAQINWNCWSGPPSHPGEPDLTLHIVPRYQAPILSSSHNPVISTSVCEPREIAIINGNFLVEPNQTATTRPSHRQTGGGGHDSWLTQSWWEQTLLCVHISSVLFPSQSDFSLEILDTNLLKRSSRNHDSEVSWNY